MGRSEVYGKSFSCPQKKSMICKILYLSKTTKFDIRQWVLVTDWNPLTIWFYEECYIRFGAEDYTLDNLDNRFIHLTNNSVTKNSKEEQHKDIEGNMWTCQALEEHLKVNRPTIICAKFK